MKIIERIIEWNKERGLDKNEFSLDAENVNCLEEIFETYEFNNGLIKDIIDRHLPAESTDNIEKDLAMLVISLLHSMGFASHKTDEHEIIDSLADRIVFSVGAMLKLGYDPRKVMDETLKEIESRTGAYNPEQDKWVKDTSNEAKAKWYKADYSKCKIK